MAQAIFSAGAALSDIHGRAEEAQSLARLICDRAGGRAISAPVDGGSVATDRVLVAASAASSGPPPRPTRSHSGPPLPARPNRRNRDRLGASGRFQFGRTQPYLAAPPPGGDSLPRGETVTDTMAPPIVRGAIWMVATRSPRV